MKVADEDVVESREFQAHSAHLQLRALTAVDHVELVADVEHLTRRQMP